MLMLMLSSLLAIAEELGDAARTRVVLPLYSQSSSSSTIIGKLPAGTTVRFKGERALPLILVEVELETGNAIGWLLDSELDFGVARQKPEPQSPAAMKVSEAPLPTDEQILIAREPSFLYGAYVGFNYGYVAPSVGGLYQGTNLNIGGRVGLFASAAHLWELHADYSVIGGPQLGTTLVPASFGYFTVLGAYSHRIKNFELSGLLGAAFGISVPDTLPQGMTLQSSMDLTSPVLGAAASYRMEAGEFSRLTVTVEYRIHIFNSPALVQSILVLAGLSFEG